MGFRGIFFCNFLNFLLHPLDSEEEGLGVVRDDARVGQVFLLRTLYLNRAEWNWEKMKKVLVAVWRKVEILWAMAWIFTL